MLNCTIASNAAPIGVLRSGGSLTNCIVYGNVTANYDGAASAVWNSCASELTNGVQGNITANPLFKNMTAGDCRLMPSSTCRNAGLAYTGANFTLDLDLQPRVRQGAVDMGAYELLPPSGTLMMVR